MVSGNGNGVYVIQGDDVAPMGGEETHLAGADAPGVDVAVVLNEVVATNGVQVYTHPMSPVGTYYPSASSMVMESGVIGPGEAGILLHHRHRPCNIFGITVVNNDVITHEFDIVLYGNGE